MLSWKHWFVNVGFQFCKEYTTSLCQVRALLLKIFKNFYLVLLLYMYACML